MKKIYTLTLTLSLSIFILRAQTIFQKVFVPGFADGISCVQTFDSGFASMGNGDANGISLVRTDLQGNLLWAKNYVPAGITYRDMRNLKQSTDSGFVITGTAAFGNTNDILILRTDKFGNLLWCSVFDGGGEDYSYSVVETNDHSFVVSGSTDNLNFLIVKVDVNGSIVWGKTCLAGAGESYGITGTSDNGFMAVGSYDDGNSTEAALIKVDSMGNFVWGKSYGGSETDYGWSLSQANDGGFIIGAETRSFPSTDDKFYLLRTDSMGDLKWGRTYHASAGWDFPLWVSQTNDGGFVTAGTSDYTGDADPVIIKTDSSGHPEWSRRYGTLQGEYMWGTGGLTSDNGFLITSGISLNGQYAMYLVKTDSLGNSGGCNETSLTAVIDSPATVQNSFNLSFVNKSGVTSKSVAVTNLTGDTLLCSPTASLNDLSSDAVKISAFPSPVKNVLHLRFLDSESAVIQVLNMQGSLLEIVRTEKSELDLEFSDYPDGIYFIRYVSKSKSGSIKIEKLR